MKSFFGSLIGTIIISIIGYILFPFGNPQSTTVIHRVITVTEKDISARACNCFATTCSTCLMSRHAGNHAPVNPDPSVLSPREQSVQTHSESEDMMSEDMIRQRAKKIEGLYQSIWHQQIVNQQKANR